MFTTVKLNCRMQLSWLIVGGILLFAEVSSIKSKLSLRHLDSHKNHRLYFEDNDIGEFNTKEEQKAMQHSIAVTETGACEVPKVQLVHVNDHYPDSQKFYLPHCTLLHRCGKHAGCCGTDKLRCVAAEKEKVMLYFYSVRVIGDGIPSERSIEKLSFTNHTKCACVLNHEHAMNDL